MARTIISTRNILDLAPASFSLSELEDFPYSEYTEKQSAYEQLRTWYDGSALDAQVTINGKKTDLYPVRINPVKGACMKHTFALFGEFPDDLIGPLVRFRVLPSADSHKEVAKHAEDLLNTFWWENAGGAQMFENGVTSQRDGGCVWKVSYTPWDTSRQLFFKPERIDPKEFWGVPYDNNPWLLKRAWVIREITKEEALEYGVELKSPKGFYIEDWTPQVYSIRINDSSLTAYEDEQIHILYEGEHGFGLVPFVYIPHERAGGFWGESMISPAVKGLTTELNRHYADLGDATNAETHGVLWGRNWKGTPQMMKIAGGPEVMYLGAAQGLSPNEPEPHLDATTRSQVTASMIELGDQLMAALRRETDVPAVADGEDEGSQRSSLTLVTRMWPLVAHIKMERVFWGTGLALLNQMFLKMAYAKGLYGIDRQVMNMRIKPKWYPVLPRDREALINEAVNRIVNNLGSPELLLEALGDVEDIDFEIERIKKWLTFLAETQAKARPAPAPGEKPNESKEQTQKRATQAKSPE